MDGGWLGHVGSESQGELSETEERALVQDMLPLLQVFEDRFGSDIRVTPPASSYAYKTFLWNFVRVGSLSSILGEFVNLQKATISFIIFVRLSVPLCAWKNSAPTGQIFMKFYICGFLQILPRKCVPFKSDKNNGFLTWRKVYLW